ncbi:MAG: substrate-binding domain-containing protein [Phycisphaeraceae bacterium]|nr:substrate-binding domain-containing protein [Phycisphaeraceae bacterium]
MHKKVNITEELTQKAYQQLKDHLIDAHYAPGEKLPSLRKMTETYGFRRNTLWRAIQQLKNEDWLEVSSTTPCRVAPSITHSLLPRLSVAFMVAGDTCIQNSIFQRVYDTLVTHGPRMNIYPYQQLVDPQADIQKLNLPCKTDMILLSSDLSGHLLGIEALGIPLIGIDTPSSLNLDYAISTDHFFGGQMACPPLLQSNPTHVMVITPGQENKGPDEGTALRSLGFRKAWVESGRSNHHVLELVLPVSSWEDIRLAIHQFMIAHPQIQGIFAATGDKVAMYTIDVLKQLGHKVPADVPVVGFDGSPQARMHNPPITTIGTPMESYAIKALQLTRRLLQNDPQTKRPEPSRMEIKPHLILGMTTLGADSGSNLKTIALENQKKSQATNNANILA